MLLPYHFDQNPAPQNANQPPQTFYPLNPLNPFDPFLSNLISNFV